MIQDKKTIFFLEREQENVGSPKNKKKYLYIAMLLFVFDLFNMQCYRKLNDYNIFKTASLNWFQLLQTGQNKILQYFYNGFIELVPAFADWTE
jgi:hypothetical protein